LIDRTIRLWLDLERGTAAFAPGARVTGMATWSAPDTPSGMELRLVWTTHGPGGRDFTIVETVAFTGPLTGNERRPFALTLPMAPYSFRGTLISLVWTLQLVALPGEESTFVELTVAPGAEIIELGPQEP